MYHQKQSQWKNILQVQLRYQLLFEARYPKSGLKYIGCRLVGHMPTPKSIMTQFTDGFASTGLNDFSRKVVRMIRTPVY